MPAEIEANDEALYRYCRWIDLPTHAPDKHLGIEVIWADQPLSPTLTPTLINSTIDRKSSPAGVSR